MHMPTAIVLGFAAVASSYVDRTEKGAYTKEMVVDIEGAVCLDGTPAAYYIRQPSLPSSGGASSKQWYLHFEGGGWCVDLASCLVRSSGLLGSSKTYPEVMVPYQDRGYFNTSVAYFSTDPKVNPMMYNWRSVFIRYCDGTSFTGMKSEPTPVQLPANQGGVVNASAAAANTSTKLLYFRGGVILKAVIAQLIARHQLDAATDVVVGGASAGGLSAYLHADKFTAALPKTARVTALPDSGFFLQIGDSRSSSDSDSSSSNRGAGTGVAVTAGNSSNSGLIPGEYVAGMKAMTLMANSTPGLSTKCVAARSSSNAAWQCIFAQVAAQHLETPTFALQSAYDSWQLANEMLDRNASHLNEAANAYGALLRAAMNESLLADSKHGAFLESCEHHCFKWGSIAIDGDVQAAAFQTWYDGNGNSTIRLSTSASPGQFNAPTTNAPLTDKRLWVQDDEYPCDVCCHGGGNTGNAAATADTADTAAPTVAAATAAVATPAAATPPGTPAAANRRTEDQPSRWQYHLLPASSGGVCLDGSPAAFDFLPYAPLPAGPAPLPRCQLARTPSAGHASYSYFIKTGGNNSITYGFNEAHDKCCRQSAKDCHWFISSNQSVAEVACSAALTKTPMACLPCTGSGADAPSVGCPSWSDPPAPGYTGAKHKWQIHLAGGGWCYNGTDCAARTLSYLGSSRYFNTSHVPSGGIMSGSSAASPSFFAWNKVPVSKSGNPSPPPKKLLEDTDGLLGPS